jgi:hypothetical protein
MFFIALTPTLSQRERVGVRGHSCCDFSGFKVFETVSEKRPK